MSILESKSLSWYPSEWVVSCLKLGKTNWCRRSWLTLIASFVSLAIGSLFADPALNATVAYGTIVTELALGLFFIGWFSLAMHYAQAVPTTDEVVIDQFFGILLMLGLSSLGIVYIYKFSEKVLHHLCTGYIHCVDPVYWLGYVLGITIAAQLYFGVLWWRPWPIKSIGENVKGAIGTFLDDWVAIVYAIPVYYLVVFLFFGGRYDIIMNYFSVILNHVLGIVWYIKDTVMGYIL